MSRFDDLLACNFNTCRRALTSLNYFYIVVGCLLILTGAYAKSASMVTSLSLLGAVIAVGIFLVLVALLGLYGTRHQHQPTLFFYMLIMSAVFVVQFSVAIACLSNVSDDSLQKVVEAGWNRSSKAVLYDAQKAFGCCGLYKIQDSPSNCKKLPCWEMGCQPCIHVIVGVTGDSLSHVGGLGLLFSFSELIGVWLAYRFRNLRDPRVNPDALFSSH